MLSEIPQLWRGGKPLGETEPPAPPRLGRPPAPSRTEEYLFYQSLLAVWPLEPADETRHKQLVDRMQQYMEKATREAKLHTSWINPNPPYDAAVRQFVADVLEDHPKNRFLADFRMFCERLMNWGLFNALSQVVLKLMSPGVPDIYWGQELWAFDLVDPDNRRPVDFDLRSKLLAELRASAGQGAESLLALVRQLAKNPRDPRAKLFVTWRLLQWRRRNRELFQRGEYLRLEVEGAGARHVCAFARQLPGGTRRISQIAIVVVPRWMAQLTGSAKDSPNSAAPLGPTVWEDTRVVAKEIGPGPFENLFTGQVCQREEGSLPVATILSDFPVCVLTHR